MQGANWRQLLRSEKEGEREGTVIRESFPEAGAAERKGAWEGGGTSRKQHDARPVKEARDVCDVRGDVWGAQVARTAGAVTCRKELGLGLGNITNVAEVPS